jgi:hypothetical protein
MVERREHPRRAISLALRVDTESNKNLLGITRNLSARGVQFHGATPFDIGERLALWLYEGGCEKVDAFRLGTVIRAERDSDRTVIFPHVTAVQLDEPLPKRLCPRH